MSEEDKAMVRRIVEGINAGVEEATVDELFDPRAARRVKRLFAEFRTAFPDWQEEIVQLVAEGPRWRDASAARAGNPNTCLICIRAPRIEAGCT